MNRHLNFHSCLYKAAEQALGGQMLAISRLDFISSLAVNKKQLPLGPLPSFLTIYRINYSKAFLEESEDVCVGLSQGVGAQYRY